MRAVISTVLAAIILSSTAAAAQTGTPTPLLPSQMPANQKLRELVQSHPREEIRTELNEWIVRGPIFLSFQSDRTPDFAVDLVRMNGEYVPTLTVNPAFITTPTFLSSKADTAYKQLLIYYEYVILKNHLSGKLPLRPPYLSPNESLANRAEYLWQIEYEAYRAEWQLAKELRVEYLMDPAYTLSRQYGEKRGVLEGFAALFMRNDPNEFSPLFKAIYLREVARLKRKS